MATVGRPVDLPPRHPTVVATDEVYGVSHRRRRQIRQGARQARDDRTAPRAKIELLNGRAALRRAAAEDEQTVTEQRSRGVVERLPHRSEPGEPPRGRIETEDPARRTTGRVEAAGDQDAATRRHWHLSLH